MVVNEAQASGLYPIFEPVSTYKTGATSAEAQTDFHLPRLVRYADTAQFSYTTFNLQNTGNSSANVTINYFDQLGQPVGNDAKTIPANSSAAVSLNGVTHPLGNNFNGTAQITSDQPLLAWVDEYGGGLPGVTALKRDTLHTDTNSNGLANPSDTLAYTIRLDNPDDFYDVTTGDVLFTDTPDTNTSLVAGSVTTTQGTITGGNGPSDTAVSVNLGSLTDTAVATVTFRVTITNPFPAGTTQVSNQGTVSWDIYQHPTDDPDFVEPYNTYQATTTAVIQPTQDDTDGDGISDTTELDAGTDPNDPTDNDTETEKVATIVAASDNPADGAPSLTDLTNLGLTGVNADNLAAYEEAIAAANPAPASLADLQALINAINSPSNYSLYLSFITNGTAGN